MIGDYFLLKLTEERLLDQEPTISFDEMLSGLGITSEDLESVDVEIE